MIFGGRDSRIEGGEMNTDITRALGAVTRVVRDLERDGRPARAVIASRDYTTSPEDLWDACTNPERIARWFSQVSGDLRLGGKYQIKGNAGGTILHCDRPRHLGLTWEFGGQLSWVGLRFSPGERGGTRLE